MPASLSHRLALPFLAFVAIGSTALVAWLHHEEVRESQAAFLATAKANARFIRGQRLPPTERTARALGEVLGLEVFFLSGDEAHRAVPDPAPRIATPAGAAFLEAARLPPGSVRATAGGESVRVTVAPPLSLILCRDAPAAGGLWTPRTLAVLGAFWALSLALAWALAGGIVRPLRELARRLPRIAEENAGPLPEATRTDEIGQLARAYEQTHSQLATERHAREQAERLATLGRMATGLAHEINNPVAAIRLHAQLLESGTTTVGGVRADDGLDSLGIILEENAKIEALVNQWMFLARPQPPALAPCDPAELVAAALRTHAPAAAHARVKFEDDMPRGHPIAADARRLGQAIANVVTNAIQAMSASGGTLRVGGRLAEHGEHREAPSFVITFADTGPGFSSAALARHAELFYSEKEGGMGIGLNVAAEILRAHGGRLRVENAPAGGAIVTFTLPLSIPAKSQPADPQSQKS